jgi:hypothetical protein
MGSWKWVGCRGHRLQILSRQDYTRCRSRNRQKGKNLVVGTAAG